MKLVKCSGGVSKETGMILENSRLYTNEVSYVILESVMEKLFYYPKVFMDPVLSLTVLCAD